MPDPGELVIPAGFVQMSFIHQQNDTLRPGICTLGAATTDLDALSDIADGWGTTLLDEVNNSWTYVQFKASIQEGEIFSKDEGVAGAGGGSGLVPNTAYLFRKQTAFAGRGQRGRLYLPGCDETSVDADGRVTEGKQGGLQTAMNAFLAIMGGLDVEPTLLHTQPEEGSPLDPTPINAITVQPLVATQRRRLRK